MKTDTDTDILGQLTALSNRLGRPENDYLIVSEGNTSARADTATFWVKASGTELRTIGPEGFVRVAIDRALAVVAGDEALADNALQRALEGAKVDPGAPSRPSVETLLHAQLLSLEGVQFVAHTHPTAVNALTCSAAFPKACRGRLFPDEIVLCGVAPLLVPYVDPGLPLARAVRDSLQRYLDRHGQTPKIVLMQNHGLIALGRTPRQVEDTTAMAVKTARILAGTFAFGGPHFLAPRQVDRIHTRPDELYRRQKRDQ